MTKHKAAWGKRKGKASFIFILSLHSAGNSPGTAFGWAICFGCQQNLKRPGAWRFFHLFLMYDVTTSLVDPHTEVARWNYPQLNKCVESVWIMFPFLIFHCCFEIQNDVDLDLTTLKDFVFGRISSTTTFYIPEISHSVLKHLSHRPTKATRLNGISTRLL